MVLAKTDLFDSVIKNIITFMAIKMLVMENGNVGIGLFVFTF